MPDSPTKEYQRKVNHHRPTITSDAIQQRQDLQKSVLKHTNRLINQLLKNLDEADIVIKKRLSPSHLERLISYLRDDIQPLRGFINKISLHAENLGSMKKEYELQGVVTGNALNLSLSTTTTDSNSSFTKYMLDRRAREPSPVGNKIKATSPPYMTPRQTAVRRQPIGYVSKSCSPIRFASGDSVGLSTRDSSEQVDLDCVSQREHFEVSHTVVLSRCAIAREVRKIYNKVLICMLYWKYKLTGTRRISIADCVAVVMLLLLLYRAVVYLLDYGWKVYKTTTGMRRGVKPM